MSGCLSRLPYFRANTRFKMAAADGRPLEASSETTAALITKYFPFKYVSLASLKALPSYDDRNIYFSGVLEDDRQQYGEERPFVLKLSNCILTDIDFLRGVNAVMQYLSEKGFSNCCPIASRRGSYVVSASESEILGVACEIAPSSMMYPVRVLTFLSGEVMDKLEKEFLTPELSYSVGDLVGRMDLTLQVAKLGGLRGLVAEETISPFLFAGFFTSSTR